MRYVAYCISGTGQKAATVFHHYEGVANPRFWSGETAEVSHSLPAFDLKRYQGLAPPTQSSVPSGQDGSEKDRQKTKAQFVINLTAEYLLKRVHDDRFSLVTDCRYGKISCAIGLIGACQAFLEATDETAYTRLQQATQALHKRADQWERELTYADRRYPPRPGGEFGLCIRTALQLLHPDQATSYDQRCYQVYQWRAAESEARADDSVLGPSV